MSIALVTNWLLFLAAGPRPVNDSAMYLVINIRGHSLDLYFIAGDVPGFGLWPSDLLK